MGREIGTAYISILPSASQLGPAIRQQLGAVQRQTATGGAKSGRSFVSGFGGVARTGLAAIGIAGGAAMVGGIAKNAVDLEASFSKTMNTMAAVAGVPADGIKQLSALAMKMGADTVFSANDAADAMLELAKGGLTAAQIKGGALQATLTLASAGGLGLADAATISSNALNTFGLKAKDTGSVAAALAGGANASSASVESLGQALQQVGPGAKQAGMTLQETVGVLSAFDNAGIKGSDAGTSLKTMLTRLVPSTKQSADAMKKLGLKFTDSKGNFDNVATVAQKLQDKLGGLSEEQRTQALNTIFGSDASRAAAVLMEQGRKGVVKFTKAASDQGAAQKVAAAGMKGTAGAIEQMKGSVETAELALGQLLAPAITAGANLLAKGFGKLATFLPTLSPVITAISDKVKGFFAGFSKGGGAASAIATFDSLKRFGLALLPTVERLAVSVGKNLLSGFQGIADTVKTQFLPAFQRFLPILLPVAKFLLQMFGSALIGLIQGAVQAIKGFVTVISGVMNLVAALVHGDWSAAWAAVKQIVSGALNFIIGAIKVWWNLGVLAIFRRGALMLLTSWRGLFTSARNVATSLFGAIEKFLAKALAGIVKGVFTSAKAYIGVWRKLFVDLLSAAKLGWRVLRSAFGGAWSAIRTSFSAAVSAVKGLFSGLFSALKTTASRGWSAIKGGVTSALGAIKTAFSTAVSGIGKVWSALKEAAAKPVRFVINTVYAGIRNVVDAIPGVPDLPQLTAAFAKGGPVTGGVRGKDSVNALLMPGEHVLTTEEVKRFGGQGAIFRLRAMIRNGLFDKGALKSGGDLGYDMPRFAKGGTLTSEQVLRAQQFAKSQVGSPYVWGGVGPHGYDCSGFMSAITNVLRGNSPYSRVGSTASFPWSGFEPGPGQFTIGSTNNYGGSGVGHMAGTLGGMRVESYGGHGVSITHRGYDDPGFRTVAHLGAGGAAAAKAGHWWDAIGKVKDAVKAIPGMLRELSHMGGWGGLARQMVGSIGGDLRKFVNGKIPGPGPIPGGIFDTGGVLEPGTFAYNASRKPEAVFTHRQFEGLADDVRGRRGGAAPVVGSLTITPNTGETTRDAMEEALFQLRRLQRGGRA